MKRIFVLILLLVAGCCYGQTILIDDFSDSCRIEGVWADNAANNYSGGGTIGNRFHYTSTHDPFKKSGQEKAFWTPTIKKAGKYRVEVSFRATSNRSRRVTYEVQSKEGKSKKTVDQTSGSDMTWETLGEFEFDEGKSGYVAFVSDGGGSASIDAARFTFVGGDSGSPDSVGSGSGGGMEDILGVGSPKGKTIRLDKAKNGTARYTFEEDGVAKITALLATYHPASLKVVIKRADGSESEWITWTRQNDFDPSPAEINGKQIPESMFEQKPGDHSAKEFSRELSAKKGDTFILTLEGSFGKAEPFLELSTGGKN